MRPHPLTVSVTRHYRGSRIEILWKQYTNSCIGSVKVPQLGLPLLELSGTFNDPDELIAEAVRIAMGWIDRNID